MNQKLAKELRKIAGYHPSQNSPEGMYYLTETNPGQHFHLKSFINALGELEQFAVHNPLRLIESLPKAKYKELKREFS